MDAPGMGDVQEQHAHLDAGHPSEAPLRDETWNSVRAVHTCSRRVALDSPVVALLLFSSGPRQGAKSDGLARAPALSRRCLPREFLLEAG